MNEMIGASRLGLTPSVEPAPLSELRSKGPIALFLDVDGTLVDLAPTPDDVRVTETLKNSLYRLEGELSGAVALVSGRTIENIDSLFAPLILPASGVHGAQTRLNASQGVQEAGHVGALPAEIWSTLTSELAEYPLLLIENKRYSYCVHYRLSPEIAGDLRARLENLMELPEWRPLVIEDAHYAFEIKPPTFDKGQAIRGFLSHPPFRGRIPIFVGDDKTDESGFAVVSSMGGFAYSVAGLRIGATAFFESPADVRAWLANFVGNDCQ